MPALAVADELVARGAEVTFAGTPRPRRGRAGARGAATRSTPFQVDWHRAQARRRALVRALLAGRSPRPASCVRILRRRRPARGARRRRLRRRARCWRRRARSRIPAALTEADAHLGLANRLAAPLARRVLPGLPAARARSRRATASSAGPVAARFFETTRAEARAALELAEDAFVLAVFGALARRAAPQRRRGRRLRRRRARRGVVLHVTGARELDAVRERVQRRADALPRARRDRPLRPRRWPPPTSCVAARAAASSSSRRPARRRSSSRIRRHRRPPAPQRGALRARRRRGARGRRRARRRRGCAREVAALRADAGRLGAMAAAMRALARPDAARDVAEGVLRAGGAAVSATCTSWASAASACPASRACCAARSRSRLRPLDPALDALRAAGIDAPRRTTRRTSSPAWRSIVSSAIDAGEPELVRARELGPARARTAPTRSPPSWPPAGGICVAGAHGKTTTTALLAVRRSTSSARTRRTSSAATCRSSGANAAARRRRRSCVAEGDESDRSVARLRPACAVVLNVDLDHLDHYASLDDVDALLRALDGRAAGRRAARGRRRRRHCPRRAPLRRFGVGPGEGWRALGRAAGRRGRRASGSRGRGASRCRSRSACPARTTPSTPRRRWPLLDWAGDRGRARRGRRSPLPRRRPALRAARRGATASASSTTTRTIPAELAATLAAARGYAPGARLVACFQPHMPWRTRAFAARVRRGAGGGRRRRASATSTWRAARPSPASRAS